MERFGKYLGTSTTCQVVMEKCFLKCFMEKGSGKLFLEKVV